MNETIAELIKKSVGSRNETLGELISHQLRASTRQKQQKNPEPTSNLDAALRKSLGMVAPLPVQPPANAMPIAKVDGAEGSSGKDNASINEN